MALVFVCEAVNKRRGDGYRIKRWSNCDWTKETTVVKKDHILTIYELNIICIARIVSYIGNILYISKNN